MPNDLIRPVERWLTGSTIAQSELSALDLALATPVNGDGGGTYARGTSDDDSVIAGAGVWFGTSTAHALVGIGTTAYSPAGLGIVHADSDYAVLGDTHAGRIRMIATPCLEAPVRAGWAFDATLGNVVALSPGLELWVPLLMHDGARLDSATLGFRVTDEGHRPALFPRMRVLRVDALGVATPMAATALDGFVEYPSPAGSLYPWLIGGVLQPLVYAADTNVIDVTAYRYFAQIFDESGAGAMAGNAFTEIQCAFSLIPDCRPQ